jgi:hypothetical protein
VGTRGLLSLSEEARRSGAQTAEEGVGSVPETSQSTSDVAFLAAVERLREAMNAMDEATHDI